MDVSDDELEAVDSRRFGQMIGYALGAIRRRKLLAATLFLITFGSTAFYVMSMPKSYHSDTKILAQKQQVLPMLSKYSSEEAPTYTASDIIHRRDNLRAIVEKTNLANTFPFPPTPVLSNEEKISTLTSLLDSGLTVVPGEGTLAVGIDWPEPVSAAPLVDAALESFLDARRLAELSSIEEAIRVLQARADTSRKELEALETESRAQAKTNRANKRLATSRTRRFDPVASQMKAMLDARRRVIRETEDFRQRRLEELQVQLSSSLASYGESYPSVISLKREIESFTKEPPRLAALRGEERELEANYRMRFGVSPGEGEEGSLGQSPMFDLFDEGDETAFHLRYAQFNYQNLLERIEGGKIDLETARAAFKYRYGVVWPAKIPDGPSKPNIPRYLTAAALLALLIAALGATLADLRARRFVAGWQVEHLLEMPVIAELRKS